MVLFIPHNAYHTYNMWLIAKELDSLGTEYKFLNIDKVHHEGVTQKAQELGINTIEYDPLFFWKLKPHALVTMNDWGAVTRLNVLLANMSGVPTFSVIEGVQDFEDTDIIDHPGAKKRHPYQRSEHVLLTGDYDKKFFKNKNVHVVGIARIEELLNRRVSLPLKPKIVINCNFSYGKYSNYAQAWIDDVVESCMVLGYDYVISAHIADKTDLSNYNTSRQPINDLIAESSLLVSRFSTCMLEAMFLNKAVLYYNNFNEKVDKFQEPNGAFEVALNKVELLKKLKLSIDYPESYILGRKNFLRDHVSIDPLESSARKSAKYISSHLKKRPVSFAEKFAFFKEEVFRTYFQNLDERK